MIEIEIDIKRLNNNENLKFMPFGKSFHFYAIWELYHLGSYPKFPFLDRTTDNKNLEDVLRRSSVDQVIKSSVNWCLFDVKDVWISTKTT